MSVRPHRFIHARFVFSAVSVSPSSGISELGGIMSLWGSYQSYSPRKKLIFGQSLPVFRSETILCLCLPIITSYVLRPRWSGHAQGQGKVISSLRQSLRFEVPWSSDITTLFDISDDQSENTALERGSGKLIDREERRGEE